MANHGGSGMAREWDYWTRNKLAILGDYLPAFNTASAKSSHRVYLDLMAGEPVNIAKGTSETFDGSARVAMSAKPGFTRLAFCERDAEKARQLRLDLDQRFPNDSRWQVFEGDCNDVVEDMLASVAKLAWAPVFVFIDQQAAEVSWETIQKVSTFRSGNRKSELWILMSPAMVAKGAKGTNAAGFVERVDKLYGTDDWQRIQHARDSRSLGADGFRAEMVNLFRWRLEQSLGYAMTAVNAEPILTPFCRSNIDPPGRG